MIEKPTRIRIGQDRNILDLVFVNDAHETLFFTLYVGIAKLKENDEEYVYDLSKGEYVKMRNMSGLE